MIVKVVLDYIDIEEIINSKIYDFYDNKLKIKKIKEDYDLSIKRE